MRLLENLKALFRSRLKFKPVKMPHDAKWLVRYCAESDSMQFIHVKTGRVVFELFPPKE